MQQFFRFSKNIGFLFLVTVLMACSSVPKDLRLSTEPVLAISDVLENVDDFVGQFVRWGGVIVATENAQDETRIELVAYPLNTYARPLIERTSGGRFIAVIPGFVDPLVYTQGRELTVVGAVEGSQSKQIGQYDYQYPVVRASAHRLWSVQKDVDYPDPYWYYPWYPYYPYSIYPYRPSLIK